MNPIAFLALVLPLPQTTSGTRMPLQPGPSLPSGAMIMTESQTPPGGFSFTGLTTTAACVTPPWSAKAPMQTARVGQAATAIDGKILAIGGTSSPGSSSGTLATVEQYDPATDTWSARASMALARQDLGAATLLGRVYAVGGWNSGGPLATVERYDPLTNTWSSVGSMAIARQHVGVAELGGKIYAVGGFNGGSLNSLEEYDPLTNTWFLKASMSLARHSVAVAAVGGKLFAIGGTSSGGPPLSVVEAYDPSTNTWSARPSMPTARYFAGAAVREGTIVVLGGVSTTSSGPTILATAERFDPAADTWSAAASMPTIRSSLAAASVGPVTYALGGIFASPLTTAEAFKPDQLLYVQRKN